MRECSLPSSLNFCKALFTAHNERVDWPALKILKIVKALVVHTAIAESFSHLAVAGWLSQV